MARRGKRSIKAKQAGLVIGRLSMNRRGFGFVESAEGDVYVSAKDTAGAMHGDTVGVKVSKTHGRPGRSGIVMKVIERVNQTVVGRFEKHGSVGVVVPSDLRLRHDIFVSARDSGDATRGDIVVAAITAYPSRSNAAQGVIEEVLGPQGTPGLEIEIIIRQHGLRTEFPTDADEQANRARVDVDSALAESSRRDIRELHTITVDPTDARDFDDAITVERVDGMVRLGVHIADVSHYVPWDSPVDQEARKRATSVYLVDRVIPMLPEALSNDICSLAPGQDRLSFSVFMNLDSSANIESYEIFPSVMRSDRRFDYGQVQRLLDGEEEYPDAESERVLTEFARIAAKIGERRIARGGLDFETVEAKVILAEDNITPIDVRVRERTQATNMIEEAMILANEVVAAHMLAAQAPMVYRIHEEPGADALSQIGVILKEFDYPVKDIHGAAPSTFQAIIEFARERPEKLLINSLLLRAMQRARYVNYHDSHFGLASQSYTHFTSPIRRYPDLLVHRLLRAQLEERLSEPPTPQMAEELEWLTEHCSIMEREAESAENESVQVKLAQLMEQHLGEAFDGIVTGVHSFGLFVQLSNTAEGLVHVNAMTDDYYVLDPERFMLIGENRGRVFRLGQGIRVRIVSVSASERRIDFELS